jgi:hypothetical protein
LAAQQNLAIEGKLGNREVGVKGAPDSNQANTLEAADI